MTTYQCAALSILASAPYGVWTSPTHLFSDPDDLEQRKYRLAYRQLVSKGFAERSRNRFKLSRALDAEDHAVVQYCVENW